MRSVAVVAVVITVAAAVGFVIASTQGSEWAHEATHAAINSSQGTGSFPNQLSMSMAAFTVHLGGLALALIATAIVRAEHGRPALLQAGAVVAGITVALLAGFASTAGMGGADLARQPPLARSLGRDPALLSEWLEEYGLTASPFASIGGVAILVATVSAGALIGYWLGGRARRVW